jgi:hypothetical protein
MFAVLKEETGKELTLLRSDWYAMREKGVDSTSSEFSSFVKKACEVKEKLALRAAEVQFKKYNVSL